MDPWVIFDADNTLWEIESLYDDARRTLSNVLAARGIDAAVVAEMQHAIDEELYKTYGYSAQRFPASFDRTLTYFFPSSSEEERTQIRSLAERVFHQPAIPHPALSEIISRLRSHYSLGIVTAGEDWVQQARLDQFAHREHFNAIEIVPRKDAKAFSDFADRHQVDRKLSWVVGDSIRSDILPAHSAGLNTILVASNNWQRIEMNQAELPQYVHKVEDLADILEIVPLSVGFRP
jgi:putative hydrolase of the HAD superfamily